MHIHTEVFPSAEPSWMTVVLVHGAGDHCGRYAHLIDHLNQAGLTVVTGDLPGHGRSGGLAGHVDDFHEYLDAVEGWLSLAEQQAGTGPIALVGHSMGGLTAIRLLQERAERHQTLRAAVLMSPCLRLAMQIPPVKKWLGDRMNTIWPRLRQPSGIDPVVISRVPEAVERYRKDPLCGGKVSVRFYNELVAAMEQARLGFAKDPLPWPILVLQGEQDRLVDVQTVVDFAKRLPSGPHQLLMYQEGYHELWNEPEQVEVFDRIVQFLQQAIA